MGTTSAYSSERGELNQLELSNEWELPRRPQCALDNLKSAGWCKEFEILKIGGSILSLKDEGRRLIRRHLRSS